jgi:8-oxo-dGTP diphosphatase
MLFRMDRPRSFPPSTVVSAIVPTAAVNAAFVDARGRVLLTRRSARVRSPGFWCLPGGHVERGEGWWAAMRREAGEEVGLEPLEGKLVGIYADPAVTLTRLESEGVLRQFVAAVFRVDRFRGEPCANDEVDAMDWFPADRLPEPLLPSHPPRIRDVFAWAPGVFVR